jgi:thiamine-phosphate pyrophosphorylase
MRPVLCLITDRCRGGAAPLEALVAQVQAAARAGVTLVQVRERDLDGGPLLAVTRACVAAVAGTETRVLVNDRVDVALAAGAHGVHLRSDSFSTAEARRLARGRPFIVGRSVHALDDAVQAAVERPDYLLFGTVFETSSKPGRAAAGTVALREVVAAVRVPVLAVGGVTVERVRELAATGAAGVAAIGLFRGEPPALGGVARSVRAAFDTPSGVP